MKRLYEDDDGSLLPAACVRKLKAILAALQFANNLAQVETVPGWNLHPLKGGRKGEYSMTVTSNWRVTFTVQGDVVIDVNFEDYH